jgi:hypothetical protein
MERQWGFTHTLMKGKEYVLSEVHLLFMIYNLRRSMSVLGLEELKKRLKILIDSIFDNTLLLVRFFSLLTPFPQTINR